MVRWRDLRKRFHQRSVVGYVRMVGMRPVRAPHASFTIYRLDQVREVHAMLDAGAALGKSVLIP